jgi:hypothetical protein
MREGISVRVHFSAVIPANAGVQGNQQALATLDPGFRRDDEQMSGAKSRMSKGGAT